MCVYSAQRGGVIRCATLESLEFATFEETQLYPQLTSQNTSVEETYCAFSSVPRAVTGGALATWIRHAEV